MQLKYVNDASTSKLINQKVSFLEKMMYLILFLVNHYM